MQRSNLCKFMFRESATNLIPERKRRPANTKLLTESIDEDEDEPKNYETEKQERDVHASARARLFRVV